MIMKKNVSTPFKRMKKYEKQNSEHISKWMPSPISGSGKRSGKILQRFPEKDWPDTPFIEGIEWVSEIKVQVIKVHVMIELWCDFFLSSSVNRSDGAYQMSD